MTAHGPIVDTIRSAFPETGSQLLGTVLAVGLLFVAGELVRRVGPYLKSRLDDAIVESVQAALMTVLTALVGAFLVVVWRATGQVVTILSLLNIERPDVIRLVFTLAILAAAYSLTRVTKTAIKRLARQRGPLSNHQQEIAHHIVQIAVFLVAGFVILGLWAVKLGGLVVGAGVVTVIGGLAARQTLGAVLAGFVVLFSRPFEMGDWIKIDDKEGVVTDITIVNTELRTFDDEVVMIPNDEVTSTEVVNRSRRGRLRLDTDVGVDYDTDLEHAMAVATGVLEEVDVVEPKPDPHVVLKEFGGSSVVLRLRYYIKPPSARKMWKARTEVITGVKAAFDEEGVKIPFPQRELSQRGPETGFEFAESSGSGDGGAAESNGDAGDQQ